MLALTYLVNLKNKNIMKSEVFICKLVRIASRGGPTEYYDKKLLHTPKRVNTGWALDTKKIIFKLKKYL